MVINKSIELFVDTHCHTMLADREVVLSHMTSHDRLCLSRKHVQSEDCSLKWSILQHLPFFECKGWSAVTLLLLKNVCNLELELSH